MAWSTARILLQLTSPRVQRNSFASTTTDGSSGQRLGPIGTLESKSGAKLNMDGFPRASKGSYMECLFSKWLRDNSSIHGTWHQFFKELVENNALDSANDLPSTQSDSDIKPESESPRQEETLPPQPKLGSVLPAVESQLKVPEQITLQKTPEEPEKAAKRDQKAPLRHRRIPKFPFFKKFAMFRRQASSMKKTDKSLHRAQRIPGSKCGRKWRTKGNNIKHFKSYYEEKLNIQNAKDKENKLIEKPKEKPQEKPQPSHLGEGAEDPNPTPKTLANDMDNSTKNMSPADPIYQERKCNKMQPFEGDGASKLYEMPSDIKTFTDLPRTLIDSEQSSNSEDKVLMSEDKAAESVSSNETPAGPDPENLSGRPQSPLGDVTNKMPQTDAASQQSSDP